MHSPEVQMQKMPSLNTLSPTPNERLKLSLQHPIGLFSPTNTQHQDLNQNHQGFKNSLKQQFHTLQ